MPVLDSSTEPQLTANTDDELMELYLSLYDRYISIKMTSREAICYQLDRDGSMSSKNDSCY